MKNLINYYYGLQVDEFKKNGAVFCFKINNFDYEFIPFDGNINLLSKIYSYLIKNYIYCHEIIINKNDMFVTYYNNYNYILIKKNINSTKILNINDILLYDINIYSKPEKSLKTLWENKIDYYEYQISQIGFKYPVIRRSFSYYIGMGENAVSLLNYVDDRRINYNICHKRINYKETIADFLNPLNMIIDNKTRDIAEYLKVNYIKNELTLEDVIDLLNEINFDNNEVILFFARLMFPSFYFDEYDKVIQNNIDEKKIEEIIKKNDYYESFLKKIYKYLRDRYNLFEIEWLEF